MGLKDIHGKSIHEGDTVIVRDVYDPFDSGRIYRNASEYILSFYARVIYTPEQKPAYSFELV